MTSSIALLLSVIFVLSATCSGQFLATDTVNAPSFNSTLYLAGPGGTQQVLYEDVTSGVLRPSYASMIDAD